MTYTKSKTLCVTLSDNIYTVLMGILTMFSGSLHLFHHYNINLAHLLALKNLFIEFLNDKIRAKYN